jgi:hypothetical protein
MKKAGLFLIFPVFLMLAMSAPAWADIISVECTFNPANTTPNAMSDGNPLIADDATAVHVWADTGNGLVYYKWNTWPGIVIRGGQEAGIDPNYIWVKMFNSVTFRINRINGTGVYPNTATVPEQVIGFNCAKSDLPLPNAKF